jgi:hypothetical protein
MLPSNKGAIKHESSRIFQHERPRRSQIFVEMPRKGVIRPRRGRTNTNRQITFDLSEVVVFSKTTDLQIFDFSEVI